MTKRKLFLIILTLSFFTAVSVFGITYLLLTGPFGPPKHVSMMIVVCCGNASDIVNHPYLWYWHKTNPTESCTVTNVTILMPIIYIKDKPFYEYIKIRGWEYEVIETKYGKMLKLHTDKLSGIKFVCNKRITDIPVIEINKEVRIKPCIITNESVEGKYPVIRTVNYTVPIYTSQNLTVIVRMSVCSGISLFEPIYNGKKYCGCRVDKIVASGKGWIYGKGHAKIEMWFRKHWYDL